MSNRRADELDQLLRRRATGDTSTPDGEGEVADLARLAALISGHPSTAEPSAAVKARLRARVHSAVQADAARRHPWWNDILYPARLRAAAALTLAVLLLVAVGGTTLAARNTVPGDALYAVKRGVERATAPLRLEDDLDRHERLASARYSELVTLLQRGDAARVPGAVARYRSERDQVLAAAVHAQPDRAASAMREASGRVLDLYALAEQRPERAALIGPVVARLAEEGSPALAARQAPAASTAETAPSSDPGPGRAPAETAVAVRATLLAGVYAHLTDTIDEAEGAGAVTPSLASELRVLFHNAAVLGAGGDNAVVATAVVRLGRAIERCAGVSCVSEERVAELGAGVRTAARTLGLPEPSPLSARTQGVPSTSTPAAAAAVGTAVPPASAPTRQETVAPSSPAPTYSPPVQTAVTATTAALPATPVATPVTPALRVGTPVPAAAVATAPTTSSATGAAPPLAPTAVRTATTAAQPTSPGASTPPVTATSGAGTVAGTSGAATTSTPVPPIATITPTVATATAPTAAAATPSRATVPAAATLPPVPSPVIPPVTATAVPSVPVGVGIPVAVPTTTLSAPSTVPTVVVP